MFVITVITRDEQYGIHVHVMYRHTRMAAQIKHVVRYTIKRAWIVSAVSKTTSDTSTTIMLCVQIMVLLATCVHTIVSG
jgi:hypothetical protein